MIPFTEVKQLRRSCTWDGDEYPAATPVYLFKKQHSESSVWYGFIRVSVPGKSCLFRFVSLLDSDLEPYDPQEN